MEREVGFRPGQAEEERKEEVAVALGSIHNHELFRVHRPKMLGEGTYQAVFTIERPETATVRGPNGKREIAKQVERGLVTKVSRFHLAESLRLLEKNKRFGEKERTRVAAYLERVMRDEQENIAEMEAYFPHAVLRERLAVMDVPVNQELLRTLTPQEHQQHAIPPGLHELPTIVTLQQRVSKEAFGEGSLSLQTYYVEDCDEIRDGSMTEEYDKINRYFIDNEPFDHPRWGVEFLSYSEDSAVLLDRVEQDPQFAGLLNDFVLSAIRFTEETGNVLELVGDKNARLYQKEDREKSTSWNLALIDARMPGEAFLGGRDALREMMRGGVVSDRMIVDAKLTLAHVRFINALAQALHIPQRIQLFNEPLAPHGKAIIDYFRLFDAHRKKRQQTSTEKLAAK